MSNAPRLQTSTVDLENGSTLITITNPLLKTPYQIRIESFKLQNPSFGNYYNYKLTELSTGLHSTVSQRDVFAAINEYGENYEEMGKALFINEKTINSVDIKRIMDINAHNVDYYINLMFEFGLPKNKMGAEAAFNIYIAETAYCMAEQISLFVSRKIKEYAEVNSYN